MTETIGFNMAVKNFETGIINKINGNGLPPSVTLLVLKQFVNEFEKLTNQETNKEIEEYNARKEKEHGQSVYDVPVGEQAISTDTTREEQA